MTATLSTNGQSLRDAFQAWHAERDAIDSQLERIARRALAPISPTWTSGSSNSCASGTSFRPPRMSSSAAAAKSAPRAKNSIASGKPFKPNKRNSIANSSSCSRSANSWSAIATSSQAAQSQMELERELFAIKTAEMEAQRDDLAAAQSELQQTRDELEPPASSSIATAATRRRALNSLSGNETNCWRPRPSWSRNGRRFAKPAGRSSRNAISLRGERNQLERDRAAVEKGQFEASAAVTAELNAARDKVMRLTTSLLSRTEELRTLDNRRAEAAMEVGTCQSAGKGIESRARRAEANGRPRAGALDGRTSTTPRAACETCRNAGNRGASGSGRGAVDGNRPGPATRRPATSQPTGGGSTMQFRAKTPSSARSFSSSTSFASNGRSDRSANKSR